MIVLVTDKEILGLVWLWSVVMKFIYLLLFLCRMMWISLFWFPLVTGCRMAKFLKEEGVSFENHVIATVTAADPIKCRMDCVDTPLCFSVNVRKSGETGRVTCELNDSSKTADPQDLIPSVGAQYHQMAVRETVNLPVYFLS